MPSVSKHTSGEASRVLFAESTSRPSSHCARERAREGGREGGGERAWRPVSNLLHHHGALGEPLGGTLGAVTLGVGALPLRRHLVRTASREMVESFSTTIRTQRQSWSGPRTSRDTCASSPSSSRSPTLRMASRACGGYLAICRTPRVLRRNRLLHKLLNDIVIGRRTGKRKRVSCAVPPPVFKNMW